jgi:protein-tyrosine phosphatase
MAEGLLRERLRERGVNATVSSAGISFDGRAATDEAIEIAAKYNVDITDHRSRVMTSDLVRDADLIIAMQRMHAREAIVLGDALLPRTFTLKELVRRGKLIGRRRSGESVTEWLQRAGAGRRPMELMGESADDDVADPYLGTARAYADCIAELDTLIQELVGLLWPLVEADADEGAA